MIDSGLAAFGIGILGGTIAYAIYWFGYYRGWRKGWHAHRELIFPPGQPGGASGEMIVKAPVRFV